jgi:protein TonB
MTIRFVAVVIIIAVGLYIRQQILSASHQRIESPLNVTLLEDLSPPPPKKILEQQLEEPEVQIEENVEIEPMDDSAMLDDMLGLDTAAGVAGADAFGLKAKKGGKSLVDMMRENGLGQPSAMERYGYYASEIERYLQEALSKQDELRNRDYTAIVKVWVDDQGRITRCDLEESTGNKQTDQQLVNTLTDSCEIPKAPPKEMPQPVTIKITTHGM